MDVRTEKKQISMSELRKYLSDEEISKLQTRSASSSVQTKSKVQNDDNGRYISATVRF